MTMGVTDFLRAHDKMASLLPTAARLVALQKECQEILPVAFESCTALHFESGQLVLAVPNAALLAKLKQQLPKLQEGLLQRAWQVSAIRLKLQPRKIFEKPYKIKQLALPSKAISSLHNLYAELENSVQNEPLKTALQTLLSRHRKAE